MYHRVLKIREETVGPDHPDTAVSLASLAGLYRNKAISRRPNPSSSERRNQHQALGTEHPDTAVALYNLSDLYRFLARYAEAESLQRKALAIREKTLGLDHRDTANSLNSLGQICDSLGKYAQAESLYRCPAYLRASAGPDHIFVSITLNNLALLYVEQARFDQAEPLFQRRFPSSNGFAATPIPTSPKTE